MFALSAGSKSTVRILGTASVKVIIPMSLFLQRITTVLLKYITTVTYKKRLVVFGMNDESGCFHFIVHWIGRIDDCGV